jgi:SAM-dependent methyltransferase
MSDIIERPKSITRLDIGCGPNKREGFVGVDQYDMPNVDVVLNVVEKGENGTFKRWPWEDNSVDEIHTSHFIEHLTALERIHFVNEAYRVLKPGGSVTIITPHWASNRAYGDLTHQWPPVAEMWYYYLKQEWRDTNAPHNDIKWNPLGYSCDFDATWGYSYSPDLAVRHPDHVQFALANYKEAAQDLHATLTKPKPPED